MGKGMSAAARRLTLVVLSALASGCAEPDSDAFAPKSLAYVLQADKLARPRANAVELLKRCGRDLIVVDPAYTTGAGGQWQRSEIAEIRQWRKGRRVVAYLSIGEAEYYRAYWQPAWDRNRDGSPDKGAPDFLCAENPDWEGNYKVRYWDERWQKIVRGRVGEIAQQGFDGLYLDVVDAFEFFEREDGEWIDDRFNPDTLRSYRDDMVLLVRRIAEHARGLAGPGFLIIAQNGPQLVDKAGYADTIDAIGVEDLFSDGTKVQPSDETQHRLKYLEAFRSLGKPVLLIEYAQSKSLRLRVVAKASEVRMPVLLTVRDLSAMGTAPRVRGP